VSARRAWARAAIGVMVAGGAVLTVGCGSTAPTVSPPVASSAPAAPASAAVSASPSVSATPLSPYENDPGVKTMRAFYAAAAKAVNARNLRLPELVALSTARRQVRTEALLKEELGSRVPGPVPFTPVSVRSNGPASRSVLLCVLDGGWSIDPKTGKPREARKVLSGQADLIVVDGKWKVDRLYKKDFSCAGVKV
jgi:hypothetical protein